MTQLTGKRALVTGGTRGIGRGIAEKFAAAGATVGVNYPPGEKADAEAVIDSIKRDGGEADAFEADVSDEDNVRSMIDAFEAEIGPIDVLVNNAGILTQSPLSEMSVEMWDETLAVDLRGVFLTTRFALPGMLEQESGSIINVASQLGLKGGEELVHYSAAKGGVIAMTRALAREVAPVIRVNAIAPGPVQTELLNDISEQWRDAKEDELPMDRLATVDDVTPTAVFLASDESRYYTGQTLSPDGGDVMH